MNKIRLKDATSDMPITMILGIKSMEFIPDHKKLLDKAASMIWISAAGTNQLLKLACHSDRAISVSLLIAGVTLPTKVFVALALNTDWLVQACLVHHPQCPAKVLKKISEQSNDVYVADFAKKQLAKAKSGEKGHKVRLRSACIIFK